LTDGKIPRRRFVTSRSDAGRPIGDFLSGRCPEIPAGFLKKLLRKGYVLVDGAPAGPRARLSVGQRVVLTLPEGAFLIAPNRAVPFSVVYEDDAIVVVDKPAGVVSEPGIGHKLDSLLNGLVARYGVELDRLGPRCDFGMVHRLDRDTSGLVVVARRVEVQRELVAAFRRRSVEKRYTALVAGRVERDRGTIRIQLGRERRRGRVVGLVGEGRSRSAVTAYSVVRRYPEATLIEARPETGRWHQLRLHFRAIGHPVAGDPEEGDAKFNARLAEAYGLRRMFLHAGALGFRHPCTGRPMRFHSPLPADLRAVIAAMSAERRSPRS